VLVGVGVEYLHILVVPVYHIRSQP
jgi:hypothetical protein